jgi:hypothetical protein
LNWEENDSLTQINLPMAWQSINSLDISDNPNLADISSFISLVSVSSLSIENNDALQNLAGLDNIGSSLGNLNINGNDALITLAPLSGMTSLSGFLNINVNPLLGSLAGLEQLTSIGYDLRLTGNTSLTSLAPLSALTSVGQKLVIVDNDSLSNLGGLEGITQLGIVADIGCFLGGQCDDLDVRGNALLENVDALDALVSVLHNVRVSDNPALVNCSGLLKLLDNTDHGAPGPGVFPGGIPDVGRIATLSGNLSGCNDVFDIDGLFRDQFE